MQTEAAVEHRGLKHSPLAGWHRHRGARMTAFAGWEMPLWYRGITAEHMAVRATAGLFDASHMGRLQVSGSGSRDGLQNILTIDLDRLRPGEAAYTLMCQPDGGIRDDLVVYCQAGDHYLLVVNAVNTREDREWLRENLGKGVPVHDCTLSSVLFALQGPASPAVATGIFGAAIPKRRWEFCDAQVQGIGHCLVSRTGYTGEDGFEVIASAASGEALWERLMACGEETLVPSGLGARDTLRLEAGLSLYGRELTRNTNPLEAGLGRFIAWEKNGFTGSKALHRLRLEGLARRLAGIVMLEPGIPRQGYGVTMGGKPVGQVTSGAYAPYLEKALAMVFIDNWVSSGTHVAVTVRGRELKAVVVDLPFYRRSSS